MYRSTFGFIYRDDDAYATYHAALYARHPDRRASLAITVRDDWSDDADQAERISVALRVQSVQDGLAMTVVDSDESPWARAGTHAGMLDRTLALAHPRIGEIFHVADHIVNEDLTVKAHLRRGLGRPDHGNPPVFHST